MDTQSPHAHEDMHVHSTFSDGKHSLAENLAEAESAGLLRLRAVDHVRRDTPWVLDFVMAVRCLDHRSPVELSCGLEAKLVDENGTLDLPADGWRADAIYVADHQVPLGEGCAHPRVIRDALEDGSLSAARVLEAIVGATERAMRRYPHVVIAHLFSVLPKVGLCEDDVHSAALERLAEAALDTGAQIEIDERWRCPSARTVAFFLDAGVPVLLSTDSHRRESIGRYAYATHALQQAEASLHV